MTRRMIVAVTLLIALLAACAPLKQWISGESGNVQSVSAQDADMNAAIQQAQQTLPRFTKALEAPSPTQSHFAIKVRFPYGTGGEAEHMWVSQLSYAQGRFQGTLDNSPSYVTTLKVGDAVTVDPKDVSDWMIVDNGKLLGGFTIHALRNRMSPADRAAFDAQFGVTIPDQPALP